MNVKVKFNEAASNRRPSPGSSGGLTLAIRADEHDATAEIKENLINYLKKNPPQQAFFNTSAPQDDVTPEKNIEQIVHKAYRAWVRSALEAVAQGLNYSLYNVKEDQAQILSVDFYSADELAQAAILKGEELVKKNGDPKTAGPILYVSLDDMIHAQNDNWGEIAISRQFSLTGEQIGYRARPGKKPLEEQMQDLVQLLGKLKTQYGEDISIVLVEDNVRHAKVLNLVIDLMEKNNVFVDGKLAGIATCFCVATEEERQKIVHRGQVVPLTAVVDFKGSLTDVVTPRDLLFDGHVVDVDGEMTRLPAIFMNNAEKLFKISPDKIDEFNSNIKAANIEFCERIEKEFGVSAPLSWFPGARAISHVTGLSPETPMVDAIRGQRSPDGQSPQRRENTKNKPKL